MFNGCPQCGDPESQVDAKGPYLICRRCGSRHEFRYSPLFIVTGPSGSGKTTLAREIALRTDNYPLISLDSDALLIQGISDSGWDRYRDIWVWLCWNILQSGQTVMLLGGGDPADYAKVSRRHWFSSIHYAALTCDEHVLATRLRERPAWRSCDAAFIRRQIEWNRRLVEDAHAVELPYTLFDTTIRRTEEVADDLIAWTLNHLNKD